ncbi:MAG: aldolase [Sphingomonas sp.]|nr:aldolase [Sphingomonas sp.]
MSAAQPPESAQQRFRRRFSAGEELLGTFLKTPTAHATEILADVGFDFVVVDAEHAPFSRADIDHMMLAAKAAGMASVVRVPSSASEHILTALDAGAAGVLVPHVSSAAILKTIVDAAYFKGGHRGFSNSPRAGGYGRLGFLDYMATCDSSTCVIAMIEDLDALDRLDEIFAVPGLTGAFIGRGDLSAAVGAASPDDPRVAQMVATITQAAQRHQLPLIAHVGASDAPDVALLRKQGIRSFLVASDQGLMRQAALRMRQAF